MFEKIYKHKLKKYCKKIDRLLQEELKKEIKEKDILDMVLYAIEDGRRIRPLLFIITHKIFNSTLTSSVYSMTVAIELLHKASLIHDDLLDEDYYRRGKKSFYNKYSKRKAVIIGDLIVSLAFKKFLTATNNQYLINEWSNLYYNLTLGETKDVLWENKVVKNKGEIETMIYQKTANFLEFVMKTGTFMASKNKNKASKIGCFGKEMGIAFQILNDLNNINGLEKKLGRQQKKDLEQGKNNLILYLIRNSKNKSLNSKESSDLITKQANILAEKHIKRAKKILISLEQSNKYTKVLHHLTDNFKEKWYWIDRDD